MAFLDPAVEPGFADLVFADGFGFGDEAFGAFVRDSGGLMLGLGELGHRDADDGV